jgi:hypothetical protein
MRFYPSAQILSTPDFVHLLDWVDQAARCDQDRRLADFREAGGRHHGRLRDRCRFSDASRLAAQTAG